MKKIFLLCMLCLLKFNNANAQTEVEPNGIWNQSLAITLGNTADGSAGLGHEEDWWRVSIPEDGALTVNWAIEWFSPLLSDLRHTWYGCSFQQLYEWKFIGYSFRYSKGNLLHKDG
ncbi:MAG: hypothetical protein IPF75_17635 [Bacteroidetes bacterium]|nr:hypothetical protein [Bacteroidota bacterium]